MSSYSRVYALTGANRGLGYEFVRQLSEDPSTLVIALTRSETESLEKLGKKNIAIVKMDAADPESIKKAVKEVEKVTNRIDLLLNNAAIGPPAHEGDYKLSVKTDLSSMTHLFNVNVVGPSHVTREFLPLLRKGNEKKIVFISSGIGSVRFALDTGLVGKTPYSVSKSALNMVAASFSNELKGEGFTVIIQDPGWVKTDMGGKDVAELEPEESISAQLATWKKATPNETGKFYGVIGPSGSVSVIERVF